MKIVDKIQDPDIKIIKALYDKWKKTSDGNLTYEAESYDLQSIVNDTGMAEKQLKSHLGNLASFDFVEYDNDMVKLLPSGINFALGYYDKMIH